MDDVITWKGKLLAPVTSDHAFRVRRDVQLYYMLGKEIHRESSPEHFHHLREDGIGRLYNDSTNSFWTGYQYYVEVDPPKPEYTPNE